MDALLWVVLAVVALLGIAECVCIFYAAKHLPGAIEQAGDAVVGAATRWEEKRQAHLTRKTEFLAAWGNIRPGLSEQEVLKHLGSPDDVIPVEPVVWSYRWEKLTGFVMFEGGYVVGYKKPEKLKA